MTDFSSPSAKERIAADLGGRVYGYTNKQILWESDTATDAEVRATELKLRKHQTNDPAIRQRHSSGREFAL